jgi:stage II sporulation protein D
LRWQDGTYRGEIWLLNRAGNLTVINLVELEEYLPGVVPWEIGRPGPEALAAVEAQAVAARTYTLAHLGERALLGFDLWADVQDQVYRGAGDEDPVCNQAVARTTGLVLRYDNREIEAYYCSTCGGVTSNVEEVWPRPSRPYLRSHPDALGEGPPFCAGSRHYSWEVRWQVAELERILAKTLPEYLEYVSVETRAAWAGQPFTPGRAGAGPGRLGGLKGLWISDRTTSGRVAKLDVETENGVYHVRGDRVRWVLTPPTGQPFILRSALFDLEQVVSAGGRLEQVIARGHGFGHGVGLCQTGALAMARGGYNFKEILAHYYPGAYLAALAPPRS